VTRIVLQGGVVIDGTGIDPVQGEVAIDGSHVVAVGNLPSGWGDAEVLDTAGLTVLPGLIDAHSHFGLVTMNDHDVAPAFTAARIFRNCELALHAGFTTVRDTGGIDGGVAAAVRLGLIAGPRILPSGPVLSQTGGHGDHRPIFALDAPHHHHGQGLPGLTQLGLTCDGPDEVRLAARTAFRHGATQIKVCVSGGVTSLTDRIEDAQFSVEELKAAVAEADARDTYVTAHAHNVRGIRNGLEAGVQCFEHGSFLDEPTARAMSEAGAYLVPTFAVCRLLAQEADAWGVPASMVPRLAGVEDAMAASLKLARDAGVVIGSGSDLLGPEQNRRGLELAIRASLESPMTAIESATATNARIIRMDDRLGTIEPGKLADVIAVDGDPLADPELFDDPSRVVLVIQNGRVVKDLR
jgi:imidazolonepropionase-like amidohydrolase